MRVYFKAIFSLLIIISVVVANASFAYVYARNSVTDSIYLVAGADEAGQNTDSLILVRFSLNEESISVVHIPRDSLIKSGDDLFKINAVFSRARSSGLSESDALRSLSDYVAKIFSIVINGSFLISKETVIRLVDELSGVDITIDKDINITDSKGNTILSLKAGVNHLSGQKAYIYLRHRKSYPRADIGRIEAQDKFIKGLLLKIEGVNGISAFASFYQIYDKYVIKDIERGDILRLALMMSGNRKWKSVDFYTLPGSDIIRSGISYYALSVEKTDELIKRVLDSHGGIKDNSIFIP